MRLQPMELLLDGSRGTYVPQAFATVCPSTKEYGWHYPEEDRDILLAGPNHEDYWEAWQNVLDVAYYGKPDGTKEDIEYTLYTGESGDLFTIKSGYSMNEMGDLVNDETSEIWVP